jgi:hypothetical protein
MKRYEHSSRRSIMTIAMRTASAFLGKNGVEIAGVSKTSSGVPKLEVMREAFSGAPPNSPSHSAESKTREGQC